MNSPRAMLSDFGTSQDMLNSRMRTGNTGTLEYAAPESLPSPSTGLLLQVDSKADMWSLGMILHKLLFFRLPYRHASDSDDGTSGRRDQKEVSDQLEREVASYPGFKSSPLLYTTFTSRRLPRAYLFLLETLLNIKPSSRPSSERVLNVIREGRLDPLPEDPTQSSTSGNSLVPIQRRHSFDAGHEESTPDVVAGDHDAHISEQGELELDGDSALLREKRTEGTPFLRLPAPSSPALVWEQAVNVYGRQIHMKISRVLWTRTIKSCVLVAKVLSLSRVCPDTRPHALVSGAILILAIMDTWFDGFTTTLILGLIHVVLLRLACWSLAT
ncbi:putative serine/threonine-protein kinase iksA [Grifola frondosa]|uniref:mitogen-activated protein kinase kinase n=1 Tax=Grifola frondosa TaxID=5627 RepID=A0A1C7MMF8_GRIFR|nr:putative serine/threonine-protein kinase iksA [Grifola frondosa]